MVSSEPAVVPMKERTPYVFVDHGQLDRLDGAFVRVDGDGHRMPIPVGGLAALLLEPGVRISHAAVALAAQVGCRLIWVGEGGVRLYSAGGSGAESAEKILHQAGLALDEAKRLAVARRMFGLRFGEGPPQCRSLDQLRGLEGSRVRKIYEALAAQHGVRWSGRHFGAGADPVNRCISVANSCLYGVTEAAILASGYSPAIGFVHSGQPRAFVYDIADLVKFETAVPAAFRAAAESGEDPIRATRHGCRDLFRRDGWMGRLVPLIEEVMRMEGGTPGC